MSNNNQQNSFKNENVKNSLDQYHNYYYGSYHNLEEEKKSKDKKKDEEKEELDPVMKEKLYSTLFITTGILFVFFLVLVIILLSIASGTSVLKSLNYRLQTCKVTATKRVFQSNVTDCNTLNVNLISVEYDMLFYSGVPDYDKVEKDDLTTKNSSNNLGENNHNNNNNTIQGINGVMAFDLCYQGIYNLTINNKTSSSISGPWSRSSTWIIRYLQAIPINEKISCFVDRNNHKNVLWTNPPNSSYGIMFFSVACALCVTTFCVFIFAYKKMKQQRIINEGTPLLRSKNYHNRDFTFR